MGVGEIYLDPAPSIEVLNNALFLDLDGTLATFEDDPSAVCADARRNAILTRLSRDLNGRLAIISGRRISEVDRILNGQVDAVAGVHGLEQRLHGQTSQIDPHPAVRQAQAAFLMLAAEHAGLTVEMKELSVALHYRRRPSLGERLAPLVEDIRQATGLVAQFGDMVFELRTPGPNKGDAVKSFMNQPPFRGFRPIYVGDDATDESAFRAVDALGGFGVLVGQPRPTNALYRLNDVAEVLEWLDHRQAHATTPLRDLVGARCLG